MADQNVKRDNNYVTGQLAENESGETKPLVVTDATQRLKVDSVISAGGSSGTQYTEGDTDTTITGTALIWEDAGDTLEAVSAAKPLPVAVTGAGDATAANQTTIIGHVDGIEGLLTTMDADTGAIKTAVEIIDNAIAGTEMQVDIVTSALPTGAATSAKQLADGHNVTVDNAAGAAAINIQDGGNTITVDGTVTANAGTNLNTSALATESGGNLDTIAGDTTAIDGKIIACNTGAVTIGTALPAGTNAIGKLAANTGVDIGDVDVTSIPVRDRTTDNQGVALQTDAIMSDTTALTPKFTKIDAAASGDNTLVAAVADKKIRVLSLVLVAGGDVDVRFESGASGTALSGQMDLTANSGFTLPFSPVGWFETGVNTLLNVELSGAVTVDGVLVYVEV